jgi:antitoxin component HigA of HigAB toxin-antitoxin module
MVQHQRLLDSDEYRRLLGCLDRLVEKPDEEITEEEGRLLVEEYEDRAHPLPKGEPNRMFGEPAEEKGMRPSDLRAVLPKSRVSEILNEKRAISKAQ